MNALELLAELRQSGIKISVHDGHIRVKAAKGQLNEGLREKLNQHKDELLKLLTQHAAPEHVCHGNYIAPLSHSQKKLLFLQAYEPDTSSYNMAFRCDVNGPVDATTLDEAFQQLVKRHGALRTSFQMDDGDASQVAVETLDGARLQIVADSNHYDLESHIAKLATTPFDLHQPPLVRLYLLKRGDEQFALLLVAHHIIFDMRSAEICFSELFTLYRALANDSEAELPLPALDYGDFAIWQHSPQLEPQLDAELRYWCDQLRGAPPTIDLPTDSARPREFSQSGGWLDHELDENRVAELLQLAAQAACTPSTIVFTLFQVFLMRICRARDLVIGMPVDSRNFVELENTVGFFLNTLAIRLTVDDNPNFQELLAKTHSRLRAAYSHKDLAFERLVEELQPERDTSRSPVFQVMYAWHDEQQMQTSDDMQLSVTGPDIVGTATAKFDLTLAVFRDKDKIRLGFEYCSDLFEETTVAHFLERFLQLLTDALRRPDTGIFQLEMMTPAEQETVQHTFNDTDAALTDNCVHHYVEQIARDSPATVAMEFGDEQWTYGELNEQANRLARALREHGAGSGKRVAILVQRGPLFQLAMLATLKAGAAYVPLDPCFPERRITYLLEDAEPVLLLTDGSSLPANLTTNSTTIRLDEFDFTTGDAGNLAIDATPIDAAYVIYTSGSTGDPKGVVLQHRALVNLIEWQATQPGLDKAARALHFAALCFDVSFTETFSTWAAGGTLILIDEDQRRDFTALQNFIQRQAIERIFLPCAALQPFAEAFCAAGDEATSICYTDIIVSGEQLNLTPPVRTLFEAHPQLRLHNHYGPAETHVVTGYTFPADRSLWLAKAPIGKPILNTQIYLLDELGYLAPQGVTGELHIAGVSVGPGYLNNPQLTETKFIVDPFSETKDARMYRSGDLARFTPDGTLEFLGRIDDQVKVRGFRVEPSEVEHALVAHPRVANAVAGVRNPDSSSSANAQLVAWVVAQDDDPLEVSVLRDFMLEQLPDYMIPDLFVVVDELPMTPSGKIDRRNLPDPDFSGNARPYRAPETETEIALCKLFENLLDRGQIGAEDNFFHLGGQSLLAMRLVARIREQLGVALPLKFVFQYPSPCQLGVAIAVIDEARHPGASADDRDQYVL